MGNKKIAAIFIFLIGIQALSGFLLPSHADNSYWQAISEMRFSSLNRNRYSFDSFDNAVARIISPLIADYRLNLDASGYLLVAHDFPLHYFKGNYTLLTRPLFPILVGWLAKPLHLISNSYSMTFAAGLIANFILLFLTAYIFYLLVKKNISQRVAFFSSILLIFSPFVHVWLVQPETNIFGLFSIVFTLYLMQGYVSNPSPRKLMIFSLAIGFLLLGKKIFALSIFIFLLALVFKRYKEGIIFFILHLLPSVFWFFWISRIWGLPPYVSEVSDWGVGVWMLNIFSWPWHKTIQIFLNSFPDFFSMVVSGFVLLPVIFALIGYQRLALKEKRILVFGFIASFFILLFVMQIYLPRYGFWLFPVVLPLAVLGVDEVNAFLKKYNRRVSSLFFIGIYFLMIFLSFLNVYKFIDYYG